MNRLPPLPLPRARGAGKARFFAAVGLMVALVAFLARRFDLVDTGTLVVSVALAVLCALVALLCVGLTIADIWREGRRSSGTLIGTLFLVLLTLAPPLAAIAASAYFPALDDVSTDRTVPPELPPAIGPRAVPGEMLAPADQRAALQTESYPDIVPQLIDVPVVEAYALARTAAGELGWKTVGHFEPASETASGHLTLAGHSAIMGTPLVIAIRVQPGGDGTRLDIRSASRDGLPDLGENARAIRAFLGTFRDVEKRPASG